MSCGIRPRPGSTSSNSSDRPQGRERTYPRPHAQARTLGNEESPLSPSGRGGTTTAPGDSRTERPALSRQQCVNSTAECLTTSVPAEGGPAITPELRCQGSRRRVAHCYPALSYPMSGCAATAAAALHRWAVPKAHYLPLPPTRSRVLGPAGQYRRTEAAVASPCITSRRYRTRAAQSYDTPTVGRFNTVIRAGATRPPSLHPTATASPTSPRSVCPRRGSPAA